VIAAHKLFLEQNPVHATAKNRKPGLLYFMREVNREIRLKNKEIRGETPSRVSAKETTELRYDNIGHLIVKGEEAYVCDRCKEDPLVLKEKPTGFKCKKCNRGLHPDCFYDYHTKGDVIV
jgi:hypothetical protein